MIDLKPGCYVDTSCDSADACNLQTLEFAAEYGYRYDPLPEEDHEDYSQFLSEEADSAVVWLNDDTETPHCYWTHEDNSLFLVADVDSAREDVEFVSRKECDDTTDPEDASYPRADYRGLWLRVSDHGNATLYNRDETGKDTEIWSVC